MLFYAAVDHGINHNMKKREYRLFDEFTTESNANAINVRDPKLAR